MAEVVGAKKRDHCLIASPVSSYLLCFFLVFTQSWNVVSCEEVAVPFSQFSSLLKSQSESIASSFPTLLKLSSASPTTVSTSVPEGESLWDVIRKNVYDSNKSNDDTNSVFAPSLTKLSSSWDWASKVGQSLINDPVSNQTETNANATKTEDEGLSLAFLDQGVLSDAMNTVKSVSNQGKGLLTNWWVRSADIPELASLREFTAPFVTLLQSTTEASISTGDVSPSESNSAAVIIQSKAGAGWGESGGGGGSSSSSGSSAGSPLSAVTGLIGRSLRAKFTIARTLIMYKFRLKRAIAKFAFRAVPTVLKVQLRLVNFLLNLLQRKDMSTFVRFVRTLHITLLKGKQRLLMTLLSLANSVPAIGTGKTTSTDQVHSPVYEHPTTERATIKILPSFNPSPPSSGSPRKPTLFVESQYGAPSASSSSSSSVKFAQTSSKSKPTSIAQSLRNPLMAFPEFANLETPSSSPYETDFSIQTHMYPTLPPVVSMFDPHVSASDQVDIDHYRQMLVNSPFSPSGSGSAEWESGSLGEMARFYRDLPVAVVLKDSSSSEDGSPFSSQLRQLQSGSAYGGSGSQQSS